METRITLKDVAVTAIAIVALVVVVVNLPDRTPRLGVVPGVTVVRSPACDRFTTAIGQALSRDAVEDRQAERMASAKLSDMAHAGIAPDDGRVRAIYAQQDADSTLREQRQASEIESIRAAARAAGCIR